MSILMSILEEDSNHCLFALSQKDSSYAQWWVYTKGHPPPPGISLLLGKTLVLREIPENGVKQLLSNKESLASCDIVVFVHDSFDERSWTRNKEMLIDVVSHGEASGFEVPCLVVAAKMILNHIQWPHKIQ